MDIQALLQLALTQLPSSAVAVVALRKLSDLVIPLLTERLQVSNKVYELKKVAEENTRIVEQQLSVVEQLSQSHRDVEFQIDSGQISAKLPTLSQRGLQRLANQAEREQSNIERIVGQTVEQLKSAEIVSDAVVDDDWFARFIDNAKFVSDEQLKTVWSRVLAGEICKPGSYSVRTLDAVRNLSSEEAEIFLRLSKLAIRTPSGIYVISLEPDYGVLKRHYGLSYDVILRLMDAGLVVPGNHSLMLPSEVGGIAPMIINDHVYLVSRIAKGSIDRVPAIIFSPAGRELFELCGADPPEEFVRLIFGYFDPQHFTIQIAKLVSLDSKQVAFGKIDRQYVRSDDWDKLLKG